MDNHRFEQAIEAIEAANREDPNMMEFDGHQRQVAVVHAERRTHWIHRLVDGEPSEALLLAAKAQHIRRWQLPRDTYPRDRVGYLKWRTDLKKFHAETTAQILRQAEYNEAFIERVSDIIMKKYLARDKEVQALEDSLCLVFLEIQFSEFAKKEADKIIDILQKTWKKMSPAGQQLALELPMPDEDRAVILEALSD